MIDTGISLSSQSILAKGFLFNFLYSGSLGV